MDNCVPPKLHEKIQGLSDLELATLASLIAEQHCVIGVEADGLDGVVEELQLVRYHLLRLGDYIASPFNFALLTYTPRIDCFSSVWPFSCSTPLP